MLIINRSDSGNSSVTVPYTSMCITHAATIELVQRRANIAKVDVRARDKNVFYHN